MTNLTEKWKKGELPEGFYYVKDGGNMIAEYLDGYFYNNGEPMTSFSGGVDEVLSEVPSYEEWQKHRKTLLKTQEKNCDLEIINTKLKELLKECRGLMNCTKDWVYADVTENMIVRINQILGEE